MVKDDPAQVLYNKKNKKLNLDKEVDSFAMWGFGLSLSPIMAIGLWFLFPLFLIASFLGVIFSVIGLVRISKDPKHKKGKGYAIAGIILGFIESLILIIISAILVVSVFL